MRRETAMFGASGKSVGISINSDRITAVVFESDKFKVTRSEMMALPAGVIEFGRVQEPDHLTDSLKAVIQQLGVKGTQTHVSVPATLLRQIDMPKLSDGELFLSLSSEAERYKAFDGTEACVDFSRSNDETSKDVVFTALRQDALETYKKSFKKAGLKVSTLDVHDNNILRAMAGSGVLDSLVEQLGQDASWGTLFAEGQKLRIFIWEGNTLKQLREVQLTGITGNQSGEQSYLVNDIDQEIRRTIQRDAMPSIWLTHNLSNTLMEKLATQLNTPVKACMLSPTLEVDDPGVTLSAVGASLRSQYDFPFNLNLLNARAHNGKATASVDRTKAAQENEGGSLLSTLIPLSLVAGVLIALITGGLFLWNDSLTQEIATLEQNKSVLLAEVAEQEISLRELKDDYELKAGLLSVADQARLRNAISVQLATDLRKITPRKVWLHEISLDDQLSLEGKALSHDSVIGFSRSFDQTGYAKDLLISTMTENRVGPHDVFDFTMEGTTNLDTGLLPKPDYQLADASLSGDSENLNLEEPDGQVE